MLITNNPVRDGIRAALSDLPPPPSPRSLDVFLSRASLARVSGQPTGKVFRAFADGELTPDACDTHGHPLFLMERLPLLKLTLERSNTTIQL